MTAKKTASLFAIIKNLIQGHAKRLADLFYLASLEARLAGRTMVTMGILAVLLLFFLSSTWLSLLFLLFFIFRAFAFSNLASASFVFTVNILLFIVTLISLQKIKKNLSFPATRRQIANMSMANKERYE